MATHEAPLGAGQNSTESSRLSLLSKGESFFHLSRLTGIATKPQVLQWGTRFAGVVLILAAAHVVSSEKNNAQAEGQPNLNPEKTVTLSGIAPSQLVNPTYVNFGGEYQKWEYENGVFGEPPNEEGSVVFRYKIYVQSGNDWVLKKSFQGYRGIYTETLQGRHISIGTEGVVFDPVNNRWYTIEAVTESRPGYVHPKGGRTGRDIARPEDLTTQTPVTSEGLADETFGDPFNSFRRVADSTGTFLEAEIVRATNSAKNGIYRLKLSPLGDPFGIWAKVRSAYYNLYIPFVTRGLPQ